MNKLLYGMLERVDLNVRQTPAQEQIVDPKEQAEPQIRTNRAMRRQAAKMNLGKRWDKRLAQHYGIPKMFIQHARRHGGSTEMILSELLGQGAIKYKAMPEEKQ